MQNLEKRPLQETPTFTSPVTVFVLGILSIGACSVFAGIPAIVLGKRTLGAIENHEYSDRNKALAQAGVLMGQISLFFGAVIVVALTVFYTSPSCSPGPGRGL